jgi:hypothetical protein
MGNPPKLQHGQHQGSPGLPSSPESATASESASPRPSTVTPEDPPESQEPRVRRGCARSTHRSCPTQETLRLRTHASRDAAAYPLSLRCLPVRGTVVAQALNDTPAADSGRHGTRDAAHLRVSAPTRPRFAKTILQWEHWAPQMYQRLQSSALEVQVEVLVHVHHRSQEARPASSLLWVYL